MRLLITRFPFQSQLSGEEWHTITLAEKLRERGHHIFLVSSCQHLLQEFAKRDFKTQKVWAAKPPVSLRSLVIFTFFLPIIFLRLAFLLIRYKKKHKIDTLYCLSLSEKLILPPLARLLKIETVWVEHSRIGPWLTQNPYLFLYRLWNKLFVKKVIFVSRQSQSRIANLRNTLVIPNGIDLAIFNPEHTHSEANQILPPKSEGQFWVGTLTRLSLDKGIPDLVTAFNVLSPTKKNLHLLIVGEGVLAFKFKNRFTTENIHFTGLISHEFVVDFLKRLDIFVLPSNLHDPFGLVAAEAMATRIPVIVTDVCGIADFIKNEKHAIIVPANYPQALSKAIKKLIDDPLLREKIAQQGYEHALANFNLEKMVNEYEKILH